MTATRATVALIGLILIGCGGTGGQAMMETLEDTELVAYVDDNNDGLSFDDEPRPIHFSDYFASNRPGTKIIMLNAAAGWCGPCMHEASSMAAFAGTYVPQGVAILTAVFQKPDASPADLAFTKTWAETFQLPIPTISDSMFVTKRYFDVNALPVNVFVDATTAKILTVATGAEPGADPMKAYRELLDHYLNAP